MSVQPFTRQFTRRSLPDVAALASVRRDFATWLEGIADQTRVEDFAVVVSELGANAVRATAAGAPPASLEAWVEGDTLLLQVSNTIEDRPDVHVANWDLDDPLRAGGRGLLLVSAFVDDIVVDAEGDTLHVRCTGTLRADALD